MRLSELIKEAVKGKITLQDALDELYKLKLPDEQLEEYKDILLEILGDDDKINHNPKILMEAIPSEFFFEILQNSIAIIREGKTTAELAQILYYNYMLGPALQTYFINEALSAVRLSTFKPEEFEMIGKAYMMNVINQLQKGEMPSETPSEDPIKATEIQEKDIIIDTEEECE